MAAHFTDETGDGASATETVDGTVTVHIRGNEYGLFPGACVELQVSPTGEDLWFTKSVFKAEASFNLTMAGDLRFNIDRESGDSPITIITEAIS